MKRLHIHLNVEDLAASVGFYSKLFAAEPTRLEADYAKWMLDDPRVNFAISSRGARAGLDHLGLQAEDADELTELKSRAREADLAVLDEGRTSCCYARSDKHWITDPQGIAWEHFQTLGDIPVFSERKPAAAVDRAVCCAGAGQSGATADAAVAGGRSSCC